MSRNAFMKLDKQITPFWFQVMGFVFRGPKYDDIRPIHTKKTKRNQRNQKKPRKTDNQELDVSRSHFGFK